MKLESKKDLSVIIVNYNGAKHLKKCVKSVYVKISDKVIWELVLVNNDENQDITKLPLDFSKIKLIDHRKNVGFGAGVNLGISKAVGDCLLILNPDAEILSKNISEVLERFDADKELGIVGGGILTKQDEREWWSSGRELSLYDLIRNNLGITRSREVWNSSREMICDWVGGSAMFARKSLFEKLGGFDERFFMYFEDMDLCKRAREAGSRVLFFPYFKVRHIGGQSYRDKNLQKKHYYDSMELYLQKHSQPLSRWLVKLGRKCLPKGMKVRGNLNIK